MVLDQSVHSPGSPLPPRLFYRLFTGTLSGYRRSVVVVSGLVAALDNADDYPGREPGTALCCEPLDHIRHLGGGYA
ncbi:hypothetical protein ACSS6W_007288 [Trichoderma asperelloides]